jgi:hypothetical protein
VLLQEFGGNSDPNGERLHYLNEPFVARYVRLHPLDWHLRIGMRAGLIGCPYTTGRTGTYLGICDGVGGFNP